MIKFIAMDVDGTLTDGKIYLGNAGEEFKVFNIKDGYGIKELLPSVGIIPIILTARKSEMLLNRCKELEIEEIHQGVQRKLERLKEIVEKYNNNNKKYTLRNIAYIGDDLSDLECIIPIKKCGGLTGCPSDAVQEVVSNCAFVATHQGGDGAVRDFIEYIINIL